MAYLYWLAFANRERLYENHALNADISNFINDPGIFIQHRYKTDVVLEDIFIFPDLKRIKVTNSQIIFADIISSKSILEDLESNKKVLILGREKSGKTTLCKVFYAVLHNKKNIPILINGKEITSHLLDDFIKIVGKHYIEQYQKVDMESYYQMNFDDIYLIIDDFNLSRLNKKYKGKLIDAISNRYNNVFITVSELFNIEELEYEKDESNFNIQDNFSHYQLMPFGHLLRADFTNKWNLIGRRFEIDDVELIKKNDGVNKIIDSVIGKNLLPPYPVFLLILMQGIEAGKSHDLKTSSQGHYYNLLITLSFSKLNLRDDEINSYYNIIAEFAFHIFSLNTRQVSRDEFMVFYNTMKDNYIVIEELDNLISNLIKSRVLESRNDLLYFKYKYIYYYFVAKYLADNISSDDIRETINKMCLRLYNEEFANIIMFLTHHSKDPFVVETILKSAINIFGDFQPLKFEDDVSNISKLINEIPKIVLKEKHFQDSRKQRLKNKDEINPVNDDNLATLGDQYDINEKIDETNFINKLNLAFKTTDILGQIIRNNYGTIKKSKSVDLGEQAYLITLRALKYFFNYVEQCTDMLVDAVLDQAEINGIKDKKGIEKIAKELLFHICSFSSYGAIKRVSNAIGSDKLNELYNLIYDKHNINSVEIINICIKLDFSYSFPLNDVNRIHKKYNQNVFVTNLLKRMAIDYIYMFPTDIEDKQRICNSLSIPIESQRKIDKESTQKKLLKK